MSSREFITDFLWGSGNSSRYFKAFRTSNENQKSSAIALPHQRDQRMGHLIPKEETRAGQCITSVKRFHDQLRDSNPVINLHKFNPDSESSLKVAAKMRNSFAETAIGQESAFIAFPNTKMAKTNRDFRRKIEGLDVAFFSNLDSLIRDDSAVTKDPTKLVIVNESLQDGDKEIDFDSLQKLNLFGEREIAPRQRIAVANFYFNDTGKIHYSHQTVFNDNEDAIIDSGRNQLEELASQIRIDPNMPFTNPVTKINEANKALELSLKGAAESKLPCLVKLTGDVREIKEHLKEITQEITKARAKGQVITLVINPWRKNVRAKEISELNQIIPKSFKLSEVSFTGKETLDELIKEKQANIIFENKAKITDFALYSHELMARAYIERLAKD